MIRSHKFIKKVCPCGIKFSKPSGQIRQFDPYCSPGCKMKFVTGKVGPENMVNAPFPVVEDSAKGAFHSWIKKRDQGLPCIACGVQFKKGEAIHAAHYWKAEIHSGVEYDEFNVHACCDHCNTALDGNLDGYKTGLIKKITQLEYDLLEARATANRMVKPSKHELAEIIIKYNSLLKNQ